MTTEEPAVQTILCGTDGSADAQNAVGYAGRLARQLDAEVVLLHAIGLLEQLPRDPARPDVTIADWAAEQLAGEWSEPLRRLQVRHTCTAEDGPPLLAIPAVAARVKADLIVVASHGKGASVALPLGSTAHGLVQLAAHPLVVVPGAERLRE